MRDWVSLAPGPTLVNDGFMTSTLNIWESSNMQNTLDKDELITGGYVGIFHQGSGTGPQTQEGQFPLSTPWFMHLLSLGSVGPNYEDNYDYLRFQHQPRPRSGHWSTEAHYITYILWKLMLTITSFMFGHSFGSRLDMLDIEIGLAKGW